MTTITVAVIALLILYVCHSILKATSIQWQTLPDNTGYDWQNKYYALIENMEVKISFGGNQNYKKIAINVKMPNEKHYFFGQYTKKYGVFREGNSEINGELKSYKDAIPPFFRKLLKIKIMYNLPGEVRRIMWKTLF